MSRLQTLIAAGLIALTGLAQPMRGQETTPPKTKAEESVALNRTGDNGLVREVRLALVCYGGSSLAIYIHGNAKELHRLVKASKALQLDAVYSMVGPETMQNYMANPDHPKAPRGPEFAKLERSAQAWYDLLLDLWTNDKERIRTRVVVDVIAGTSAGGINGVFLAKALANDLSQDALTELWMEKASIRRLTDNYLGFFRILGGRAPINGKAMAGWLYDALRDMDRKMVPGRNPSLLPRGDRLDLFVTTTDLLGYPQQVVINNPPFAAEKHFPHLLHFIYSGQNEGCGQPSGKDGIFNDFCPEWTPAMAFAARSSSSIPGVFPPLHLGDTLDQFEKMPPGKPLTGVVAPAASKEEVVRRLFRNHQLQQPNASNEDVDKRVDYAMNTYFVDGGVLDNHPFGPAIAEVLRRPQDQEVKRVLLYLQPDPGKPPKEPSGDKPSLLKTIKAGLSAIPAYQPILNDLNDIVEHNKRVRRIRDIVHSEEIATQAFENLERKEKENATCEKPETLTVAQRFGCVLKIPPEDLETRLLHADQALLKDTRKKMEDEADKGVTKFAGRSYYSLRVHSVLSQFADVISSEGVNNYPAESAHRALVAAIIAGWAEKRGLIDEESPEEVLDPKCASSQIEQDPIKQLKKQKAFLEDFDIGYQRRQLRFVTDWINRQYTAEVPPTQEQRKALDKIKAAAAKRINQLTQLVGGKGPDPRLKAQIAALRELFGKELSPWPKGPGEKGLTIEVQARKFVCDEAKLTKLDEVRTNLGGILEGLQQNVRDDSYKDFQDIRDSLTDEKKLEILVRYFGFPFWDRQIYPLVAFSGLGELAEIDVFRLSPDDATLLGGRSAKEKLVGASKAHFGAFLSREGREADYVWGRLDAAERLLAVLGLEEEEERKKVAGDLFRSIIEEVGDKEKDLIRASILKKREADIAQHLPPPPQ